MKAVALPHVTIPDHLVKAGNWMLVDAAGEPLQVLDDHSNISDWSYDADFRLAREFEVPVEDAAAAIGLDGQALFSVSVMVEAGQPGIRFKEFEADINDLAGAENVIQLSLESTRLCDQIHVSTVITLGNDVASDTKFCPAKSGSVLWREKSSFFLEGSGSRFPIRSCSFSGLPRVPDDARWHLEWSPDYAEYAFAGSVILLVNTDHAAYAEAVVEADPGVMGELMSGVAMELTIGLLNNQDFRSESGNYPDGSLGAVARGWLEFAFPNKSHEEIYLILTSRTSEFCTALRARFRHLV